MKVNIYLKSGQTFATELDEGDTLASIAKAMDDNPKYTAWFGYKNGSLVRLDQIAAIKVLT